MNILLKFSENYTKEFKLSNLIRSMQKSISFKECYQLLLSVKDNKAAFNELLKIRFVHDAYKLEFLEKLAELGVF